MDTTEKLKVSYYNFMKKFDGNVIILYNSLHGTVLTIKNDLVNFAEELLKNPNYECDEPKLGKLKNLLLKAGFLISNNINELEIIENRLKNRPENFDYLEITIIPVSECNFACPYCYITNLDGKRMTTENLNSIYKFIEGKVNTGTKTVRITWHGGEPTLAKNNILSFMNQLSQLAVSSEVSVKSDMVTNGYLLDKCTFASYCNHGINKYQITLDGEESYHDKNRFLKGGHPTFKTIYQNLKDISTLDNTYKFDIDIRVNVSKNNIENIKDLINKFKNDFSNDSRFHIYTSPVLDDHFEDNRENISEIIIEDNEANTVSSIEFRNLAHKTSEDKTDTKHILDNLFPKTGGLYCQLNHKNNFSFLPNFKLYGCHTSVGISRHEIGELSLTGEIIYNERANYWKQTIFEERNEKCLECKLMPLCLGGCARLRKDNKKSCLTNETRLNAIFDEYYKYKILSSKDLVKVAE